MLLRMEEACLLVASVFVYRQMHFSWVLFAVLFLAPDLFMVGYLKNARVGAAIYNLGHFVGWPVILAGVSYGWGKPILMAIGIIWFVHIALDRMLGYGFKYPTFFKDTHLQRVDS